MKNTKKIFAIIGIVCLVLLYASTLVFALIDTEWAQTWLIISVGATIFFPVMLYIMSVIYKLNQNNTEIEEYTDNSNEEGNDDSLS